jgi:CubicO group peptidase (beta-lactamase class C family)
MFQPGSYWYYGLNFELLAYVIEKETGFDFEEFLKVEIFEPLNMNDTYVRKCFKLLYLY